MSEESGITPIHSYSTKDDILEPSILFDREGSGSLQIVNLDFLLGNFRPWCWETLQDFVGKRT